LTKFAWKRGNLPHIVGAMAAPMEFPIAHEQQNADQIAYWNGPGGQHWTDRQQSQDTLLAPIADILIDRARAGSGERIVDVGCGCGATSIAFAHKIGPTGHVLGIDISAPMLGRARQMTPAGMSVDFVLADATIYPFAAGSFDLLVSRFGVMFLMTPLQAAYKHVPKLPQLGPEDPGPFAFASEARVRRILGEAGFVGVAMERCDLSLDVAIGGGLDAAVETALEIGPASRALEGQPSDVKDAAASSIRETLVPFVRGQTVLLPASIWIVTASAT
jgi:SAM-dependent methyltransferase